MLPVCEDAIEKDERPDIVLPVSPVRVDPVLTWIRLGACLERHAPEAQPLQLCMARLPPRGGALRATRAELTLPASSPPPPPPPL
mmetsp:Transcript_34203/g.108483  ORF Transcript_34203/g.108483 Transcript_34203/m.108483 type:complete len:85 (-) Transcript_34203:19-273(-)